MQTFHSKAGHKQKNIFSLCTTISFCENIRLNISCSLSCLVHNQQSHFHLRFLLSCEFPFQPFHTVGNLLDFGLLQGQGFLLLFKQLDFIGNDLLKLVQMRFELG